MRFSKKDWLEHGLGLLAEQGVEAVTIDTLCRRLQVTKGSFYHHFAHREQFLEALLSHWEAEYTQGFIRYSLEGSTPHERLTRLSKRVIETHGTSELAIRAWGQKDPLARSYLERVDAQRLAYLQELHEALGENPAEAHQIALLTYTLLLGAQALIPPVSQTTLAQLFAQLERYFQRGTSP